MENNAFGIDEKILKFIKKMHILSLGVCRDNSPYTSSAFYAYDEEKNLFLIAGDDETTHHKIALANPNVSVNIALDTKIPGLVKGLQILGIITEAKDNKPYFKRFPFALAMKPKIFEIKPTWMKFTSNQLGKKLIWQAK